MNYLQEGQPGFWIPKPVAKKIEMLQADLEVANGEFRAIKEREAKLKERVAALVEVLRAYEAEGWMNYRPILTALAAVEEALK